MFEIHALVQNGVKKNEIAKRFNVAPTTITEFTSGRSWKHLNLYKEKKIKI
jgi:transposase